MQLNLQTTDFTVEETRSANPIELKIENPMYNLWLLHYNEEGGLVESDTEYIHLNDKGELSTNHTAKLTLQLPLSQIMTTEHGQRHCNYYRKNF